MAKAVSSVGAWAAVAPPARGGATVARQMPTHPVNWVTGRAKVVVVKGMGRGAAAAGRRGAPRGVASRGAGGDGVAVVMGRGAAGRRGASCGVASRGAGGDGVAAVMGRGAAGRRGAPRGVASRGAGGDGVAVVKEEMPTAWQGDILAFTPRAQGDEMLAQAPLGAPPIVILPGFGNCTEDYTAPFGERDQALATLLEQRGFQVFVAEVERKDFFKVARAILTLDFWKGTCGIDPGYTWFVDRSQAAVERAMEATGASQVDIVAHSAGGWLARAYLGRAGAGKVRTLLTLGSPHIEPPPGTPDMTRGALASVNRAYPGAHFPDVRYVCVTGRAVRGNPEAEKGEPGSRARAAYEQVGGDGGLVGDAVVPNSFAVLEGAENVAIDGVWHSMSRLGTFEEKSRFPWYGSPEVIDLWARYLAEE